MSQAIREAAIFFQFSFLWKEIKALISELDASFG
jgi:hypothetical protein